MTNSPDFSARKTSSGVDPIFTQRWSSCFNAQPWRFYTSTDATFDDFLNLLVEGNQEWAKNTSIIGFLVGQRHFEHNGKPNFYSSFDSGAAWMALTMQARMEGLHTHGMGGIKSEQVAQYLALDTKETEVLMGFAIGKLADLESLDDEQRSKEVPNDRKQLADICLVAFGGDL